LRLYENSSISLKSLVFDRSYAEILNYSNRNFDKKKELLSGCVKLAIHSDPYSQLKSSSLEPILFPLCA